MSTQIDLGPVLSIPKGDWNASTTYERLNLVRHNSAAWICNVDTSTGVEPSEDSVDWFLQVKDTSAVSSVNGMRGDVEITTIQTPSNDSNDASIANTEWVRGRIAETINSAHSYTDDAINTATLSILDTAAQDASSKATIAVNQALTASETKFATIKTVNDLADNISTLEENNAVLDAAVVHKTGDETIAGQKVFTEAPWIKNDKLSIPEWTNETINKYLYCNDKNGDHISAIQFRQTKDVNAIRFLMRTPKDNTSAFSGSTVFWVGVEDDGTPVACGPTPAAEDNSTKLATTAWVRGKGVLIESWREGTEWYRKYSDGWIEQGGLYNKGTSNNATLTISFHTPFRSMVASCLVSDCRTNTDYVYALTLRSIPTVTSFTCGCAAGSHFQRVSWYACGY